MFASLLVGLDGSPGADAALDAAIALGRRFHSAIQLAAVVDLRVMEAPLVKGAAAAWPEALASMPSATLELGGVMRTRADRLLAAGAARVRAAGLAAQTSRQTGLVDEELLKLAETVEALVVGRRGELKAAGELGDHTLRLVRRAPHQVVVAGDRSSTFDRPIVAYDHSVTSAAALSLAARYAAAAQVPLGVVTVSAVDGDGEALLAQAAAFLSQLDVSFEMHRLEGDAGRAIADYAERVQADAIVCGAHGRRRSWTMGSTAEALVRGSSVPVIVVR